MSGRAPLPPLRQPGDPEPPASRSGEAPVPRWVLPVVMIATLTIGGWFIIQNLTDTSKMEDCQMAGRHNCVPPIDTSKLGR